jgi:multidrug efflux pump subunit AcrB
MSILNLITLFLIAVYIAQGFHKGFLVSAGNTIGLVISWIVSIIFSPLMSQAIYKGQFYSFLLNLTEGSSRLLDQSEGNLIVSSLSQSKIHI